MVEAEGIGKGFGDRLLFEDLSFKLPPGGIVGVIGPERRRQDHAHAHDGGPGTAGRAAPCASATRWSWPTWTRAATRSTDDNTVWQEIADGQDVITVGRHEIQSRAYVGRFNFKGPDQQKRVGNLSGGERNRVHLAKLLVKGGNLLLLDEPTNDLDVDTLRALEEALLDFAGCVVVISHDRWFLDRIATHMLAFEGDSQVVWFEGNYEDYEADRRKRLGDEADRPHRIRYKRLDA